MKEHEQASVTVTSTFDLEAFASYVDLNLCEAVTRLTLSLDEKLGRKQSDVHERKVRVAYLICVIVFYATGGHCSVPLHTLLT